MKVFISYKAPAHEKTQRIAQWLTRLGIDVDYERRARRRRFTQKLVEQLQAAQFVVWLDTGEDEDCDFTPLASEIKDKLIFIAPHHGAPAAARQFRAIFDEDELDREEGLSALINEMRVTSKLAVLPTVFHLGRVAEPSVLALFMDGAVSTNRPVGVYSPFADWLHTPPKDEGASYWCFYNGYGDVLERAAAPTAPAKQRTTWHVSRSAPAPKTDAWRLAFDFLERAQGADTVETLDRAFANTLQHLGVSDYAVLFTKQDAVLGARGLGKSSFDWVERYRSNNFFNANTVIEEALKAAAPFTWADVQRRDRSNPGARVIFNEARERLQVEDGFVIPLHGINGLSSLTTLFGEDLSKNEKAQHAARVATIFAVEKLQQLDVVQDQTWRVAGACPLTRRQREVLTFVAHGRTDREIGEIVGVSEPHVRHVIEDAKHRLNVRTRVQAIIVSMRFGWIGAEEPLVDTQVSTVDREHDLASPHASRALAPRLEYIPGPHHDAEQRLQRSLWKAAVASLVFQGTA